MKSVLFCVAVGIVGWLGLRHLFSILAGRSQDGPLKPGQRLFHATSLLLREFLKGRKPSIMRRSDIDLTMSRYGHVFRRA
ncbi:MAG: hypothetical protein ACYSTF_01810 [Planctomycetota bacterium]|jgi:hypothetical protein